MQFVTFQSALGPRAGLVKGGGYVDLQATDARLPNSVKEIIAGGSKLLTLAAEAGQKASATVPASSVKLLSPVLDPQKIICVGLNYADHAREGGKEPPTEPVIFCKFATALSAHEAPIVLPAVSQKVDYEAELVVVIGRAGRNIPQQHALDFVAGYCVGHDVSARDWQQEKPGGQWLLGKSFDTFAPLGPTLVTPDEVGNAGKLRIQCRLNGQTMQDSNTEQLIFTIPHLIAYVSQVATLMPGDLIYTGTPSGVGFARKPPVFLKPGDVVEVEIEKLGVLRNPVVGP
ncbi:MAG: fumarylacetoacetate hydrolase family protein [Planctomycetes bacterium]|nr:fumarylacetoacetate hydrolase family protein [Planctomycetota bacterium]